MKKQLPTAVISSELAQSSVFFQKAAEQSHDRRKVPSQDRALQPHSSPPPELHRSPAETNPPEKVGIQNKRSKATTSRTQDTLVSSDHGTMPPRHLDTMAPTMVETIRKAVKQIGKEAATHRFTEEEKRALADIVYTYGRQGNKTSENEITRIAVNWLILDYKEQGKHSVLARLIVSLHE